MKVLRLSIAGTEFVTKPYSSIDQVIAVLQDLIPLTYVYSTDIPEDSRSYREDPDAEPTRFEIIEDTEIISNEEWTKLTTEVPKEEEVIETEKEIEDIDSETHIPELGSENV